MSLVDMSGLNVQLGGQTVLHHVEFSIDPGEIVTIVGPNGSGKTSLLRAIIGATQPATGRIRQSDGLRIGYVPQKLHIDPTLPMTVRRFLDLPQRVRDEAARDALDEAGAGALTGRQMSGLSGGQFQRVLLARALLSKPELLILDEATQGLDQPGSAAFYQKIAEVRDHLGCAVLMVSHDRDFLDRVATTTIAMEGNGRATVYAGGWSDYRSQRAEAPTSHRRDTDVKPTSAPTPAAAPKPASKPAARKSGLSFTEKHRLDTLPGEIARLEAEIGKLTELLADPDLFTREPVKFRKATEALSERQARLSAAEDEWLVLEEKASA